MNKKILGFIGFTLFTGCALPVTTVTPTPVATVILNPSLTSTFISTETSAPVSITPVGYTPIPTYTVTLNPSTSSFCSDPQVPAIIDSLKSSMRTSNGRLLSSLVHPTRGMEVRYFRDGSVINYNQEQARFLFETTFEANWGNEPGSGLPKKGAFHDVIVPRLVEIFNQPYSLHCNDLKHGGATYELTWPYQGNYYSIHFAGTDEFGGLDWHTWIVGIDFVNGKPFMYALMQFFWEP